MDAPPWRILLLLFLVGFLLIHTSCAQAVQRNSWGEYCNETTKCDKGAWLTCQSSACACLLKDMIYNPAKGKCVSKSGERCKFQLSDLTSDKIGLALYENTDCVPNAHCANGFTCSCESGFYETMSGFCEQQKEINATCVSSAECQESKHLFCINGQCLCSNESNHIYDKSNTDATISKCVGKAGNALFQLTSCIEKTKLQNGNCICDPPENLYAGEDGRCYERKGLEQACTKDEECKFDGQFLTCVQGTCGCNPKNSIFQTFKKDRIVETKKEVEVDSRSRRNPGGPENLYYERGSHTTVRGTWVRGNQYGYNGYGYVETTVSETVTDILAQCVGLAQHKCNPQSNCIKDSSCVKRDSGSGSWISSAFNPNICKCNANFSPTSTGTCGIGHGHACSEATPCSDSFRCTNGVCNCPQFKHQIFSSTSEKCVGYVSSHCIHDSDCLPNSICAFNINSGRDQCNCAEGFVENGVGKCEKAWNATCSYKDTVPCDSIAELQCRNGMCSCPDILTNFNSTVRKCLGSVGSRCGIEHGLQCVYGAKCFQPNLKVAGQCFCEDGFEVNRAATCEMIEKEAESAPPGGIVEPTLIPTTPTQETTIMEVIDVEELSPNSTEDDINELEGILDRADVN